MQEEEWHLELRRQVIDIPPIRADVTEYRQYSIQCGCGCKQQGAFPDAVRAPIQYGANVQAWIGYLSVYQHIPYKRLTELLANGFGIRLSQGTIANVLNRLSDNSAPTIEAIKANLVKSPVVGSDETGIIVNGKRFWTWVWQNIYLTYLCAHPSRGKKVIKEEFPNGFAQTILCSDQYRAQLSTTVSYTHLTLPTICSV